MDGIDFLWLHATHPMADEIQLLDANDSDEPISCYCCGRPSSEWAVPLYQLRLDSYLQLDVPICAPCNALFHGSYQYMGIEKGTPEKPTAAGKLGMLVGCGLLVTQQQKILFTNPGWDKRLKTASKPIFEQHQVSGKGALDYALKLILELEDQAFPILYIADLGRKKAELVANLRLTISKASINICSADSAWRLNTGLMQSIRTMQEQDKSGWKKLSTFIFKGCHGQIAPNDPGVHEFLSDNPEALAIARRLPADPHEKLQILPRYWIMISLTVPR